MRYLSTLGGLFGSTLLLGLVASASSGCTTEAVCFHDCSQQAQVTTGGDGGTGNGGSAGSFVIGFGGDDDPGTGKGGKGGTGGLEDPGSECDKVDLATDPNNCGECGKHCILTGAEATCVDGKCEIAMCSDNRYDVDGNPEDGCELLCEGDPAAEELCNGLDDNCDGKKDEGFDTTSDHDNCGACNVVCQLDNAEGECADSACAVVTCNAGFVDVDGVPANGCEYPCHLKDKNGVECDPATADVADGCGVEVCDTVDQDCDGTINDDTVDSGAPCSDYCDNMTCLGLCTPGAITCVGTDQICVPGQGKAVEVCDGLDNDCDGTPDQDFHLDSDPQHCGGCGTSCVGTLPHAIAKCENSTCKIDVCESDYGDLDKNSAGCEACPVQPVRSESCNGKDDDCDGAVDEPAEVALTKPATGAAAGVNSFCKQRSLTLCNNVPLLCDSNAGGWVCQYPAGVETAAGKVVITETKCDGIDGNCDTQKDEAFLDLGTSCNDGALGVCLDFGKITCDPMNSAKTYCDTSTLPDPPSGSPFPDEECNGLDDDCDGDIDEGTDEMVPITRNSLDFLIDKYEASRPDASAVSAGTDESHLCGIAGRLPWTGATFDEAQEACIASGKRLCDIEELQEACEGLNNRTYPYAGLYSGTKCNGADAPGSAAAATGSFTQCVSSDGVYDLTGNVAEWSAQVEGQTTGNPAYDIMALQGGSFLTPQNGMTCTFDLDRLTTNAVLPSLGFRCCKDP